MTKLGKITIYMNEYPPEEAPNGQLGRRVIDRATDESYKFMHCYYPEVDFVIHQETGKPAEIDAYAEDEEQKRKDATEMLYALQALQIFVTLGTPIWTLEETAKIDGTHAELMRQANWRWN